MNSDAPAPAWLHERLSRLGHRWWLPLAGLVLGLVVSGIYLQRASYSYAAELRVYAASGISGVSPVTGLGGLAALAGLSGGSGGDATPPFRYFLEAVDAPEVAAVLARDPAIMHQIFAGQWDAANRRWFEPPSLKRRVSEGLNSALGRPTPAWHPPGAVELQAFIQTSVTVQQSVRSPLAVIGFEFPDPVFATAFITRLAAVTDKWLREQQNQHSDANIAYLDDRLLQTTRTEDREALVGALVDQEQRAMFSHGNGPYAAETFGRATVGDEPARPRVVAVVISGGVAGLLLGILLAAAMPAWRRRNTR